MGIVLPGRSPAGEKPSGVVGALVRPAPRLPPPPPPLASTPGAVTSPENGF